MKELQINKAIIEKFQTEELWIDDALDNLSLAELNYLVKAATNHLTNRLEKALDAGQISDNHAEEFDI